MRLNAQVILKCQRYNQKGNHNLQTANILMALVLPIGSRI